MLEWKDGYPTEASLQRLQELLNSDNYELSVKAFYAALRENHYPDYCGRERVEVRGEVIDVWAYHTCGWSGNELIIETLKGSWLFEYLLERYDSGGHYYFRPIERVLVLLERAEAELKVAMKE